MTEVFGYGYYGRPHVWGEAPGPRVGEELAGCIKRIARLIEVEPDELRRAFRWNNLLLKWPGYGPGGGSKFPAKAARELALGELRSQRFYGVKPAHIYLGRRVAAAFDFKGEWFRWEYVRDGAPRDQVVCPHPSGLNRWWNDSENVRRAQSFWQDAYANELEFA